MDPEGQFVFVLLALVCFVASALWDIEKNEDPHTRQRESGQPRACVL